jgi:hypothetical protein
MEDVRDGIVSFFVEWWLADGDFIYSLECHDEDATLLQSKLQEEVDALEDGIFWHMVDAFEARTVVLEAACAKVARDRRLLEEKMSLLEESIEIEAVRIGL